MWFLPTKQPADPTPLLGQFPPAIGASEPIENYRHEMQRRARHFVLYTISETADYATIPQDEAAILCNFVATGQMGRPLHRNEDQLLSEAVRDVIVARESHYRMAEYLDDHRNVAGA